ncbi:MAG TPA: pyruvate formate lyase family protein, partial [Armatimonadota bacterium]
MSYPATDDLSLLTEATPRIARLREHALAIAHRGQDRREGDLAALRSWRSSSAEQSHLVRRGLMARDILCALTPVIGDDELIVGNWANRPLNAEEAQEFDFLQREVAPAMSRVDGQRSHMSIDYECLLREGVHGLRALIARYREPLDLARAEDQQQDDFYRACLVALDGMTTLAEKYADLAEQSAHDADPARAEELREIARLCRAVPAGP